MPKTYSFWGTKMNLKQTKKEWHVFNKTPFPRGLLGLIEIYSLINTINP
jgi:hypothetical protein